MILGIDGPAASVVFSAMIPMTGGIVALIVTKKKTNTNGFVRQTTCEAVHSSLSSWMEEMSKDIKDMIRIVSKMEGKLEGKD